MSNLAHSTINDTRFDDMMKDVRQFGREAGQGQDALPKLGMRVIKAAADGVIDAEKDENGHDAITKIYGAYAESQANKTKYTHTSGGEKANASKLRQLRNWGMKTTADPMDELERAVAIHKVQSEADPKKVKSVYPYLVDVARKTQELDRAIDDDELTGLCFKADPKEKTIEGEIKRAHDIISKLITGEAGLSCQDEQVIAAEENLRGWMNMLAQKKEVAALLAKAKALGFTVDTQVTLPAEQAA